MYNSVYFQAPKDIDENYSQIIEKTEIFFQANLDFISFALPDLYQLLSDCKSKRYSVFINNFDQINIRDNQSGEALYCRNPIAEVSNEVSSFFKRPTVIYRDSDSMDTFDKSVPENSTLMLFGIGAGYHLKDLLYSGKFAALLIYEADIELFKKSLYFISWQEILEIANEKNILLSIQPGAVVGNIKQHLAELDVEGFFSSKAFLYRHAVHPLTEEVLQFLFASSGDSKSLLQGEGRFLGLNGDHDYLPVRPAGVLGNFLPNFTVPTRNKEIFNRNFEQLQKFYPSVSAFYLHYVPQRWQFCVDNSGQENIFHYASRTLAYHDATAEAKLLAKLFKENPFRDSAIYSQSYTEKLSKYIHFQQILKVEKLQKSLPKLNKPSIEDIRTLAFFGTGLAQHIELTLHEAEPRNVFIFEEDPDLFYASLYVTDWAGLIEKYNRTNGHLYFNIGYSPDTYLSEFLNQLKSIGAFEISNTFLFPCYYRPHMQKALEVLREQLKTFIGLNEYYDNARYGITHFLHNAEAGACFYQKGIQDESYNCPVFIIGNGPSLDDLIEHIRNFKDDAIIISCGTALKALYEYGITPDFHAEAEQNSATYNWITKVPDRNYLKSINFLSTVAAFPETAELFKSACLAFTAGQIPSQVLAQVDRDTAEKFRKINYAFPTVTNLALSMVLNLGFDNVYLFGVDLGFADINYHHSKKSGYYTAQGDSLYDYAKCVRKQIPVKGNFSSYVFTKREFYMAKKVMERVIASYQRAEVYNCSKGVFIEGSFPLQPENILIKRLSGKKSVLVDTIIASSYLEIPFFSINKFKDYVSSQTKVVVDVIDSWLVLLSNNIDNEFEATELIVKQAEFLKSLLSKNTLLSLFLLEGSAYSFLGLMNSFVNSLKQSQNFDLFNQLVEIWKNYLLMVKVDVGNILEKACPMSGFKI